MRAVRSLNRSLGTVERITVPQVSPGLLKRYDVSVPRYTSYPAVPDWTGAFTGDAWRQHLGTLNGSSDPLALYVHLPFCASRCLYCGCNATVTKRAEVVDRYLDRLDTEMQLLAEAIGTPPRISGMHWGGGTPNFLDAAQLTRLMSTLHRHFPIDARTECSVEADPRLVTRAQLEQFRQLGFSRISFGVQDLDPVVQKAIGRVQPQSLVTRVVDDAREVGFRGINLDLIYGLPEQTAESFAWTIEESLALRPDRVACFGYAHVPWIHANQKHIDDTTLPLGAERFSLFRDAVSRFVDAGYDWLGIDHFALPEDPLSLAARAGRLHRNFMGYTTRTGENLLGIGTSAISQVNGWYAQHSPQLGDWQQDLGKGHLSLARGHVMSPDDEARATAVGHLMCNTELPFDLFVGDMYGLTDRFEAFASEGLVEFETDRVVVTPLGRFFLRNLCATLDAYRFATDAPGRFSRAV